MGCNRTLGWPREAFVLRLVVIVLALLVFPWSSLRAEVYRFKDAQGRWQFTDRPPPEMRAQPSEGADAVDQPDASADDENDLAARLRAGFPSDDPLQQATLAVVSVKAMLGQGAGFFVTDDGYLLTNRHVVRPDIPKPVAEQLAQIDREEQRLERQAHRYTAQSVADAKRELREQRREIGWKTAAAAAQQSFDLMLKGGETRKAHLVAVSQDHDLALLKIDGLLTPRLVRATARHPDQGQTVYAIGTPLGVADSLTAGRVTRVRARTIITDIQLLPGNSGGPLVNEAGELLGVNFAKLTQGGNANYQGFGMAVPIALALDEFPEIRPRP